MWLTVLVPGSPGMDRSDSRTGQVTVAVTVALCPGGVAKPDVSSATVRNILAELEAAGLLTHPHTSAGRIPTDAGYRLYVDAIADSSALPSVEQLMIRHQFGQVEFASEHWFRLAATTLASVTRAAPVIGPVVSRSCSAPGGAAG